MITSYEYVTSRTPLVIRKRVRWSDCDPAGVVYTGKFSEYLMNAVMYFFAEIGNGNYSRWIEQIGVDTPCKGLELTFHKALWPEDEFDMTCMVSTVRESSFDIAIKATRPDGSPVFSGRFSPICIGRDERKRVPIPNALLNAIAPHRA
jgi:acyl-CoA thioesterase FadM